MINPFLKGCERGLSIKLSYEMSLRLTGYKYWFSNLRSWQHSIVLAWFGMPRGHSKNILACKFLLSEWNDERSAWQKLWKNLINVHENSVLNSFFVFCLFLYDIRKWHFIFRLRFSVGIYIFVRELRRLLSEGT